MRAREFTSIKDINNVYSYVDAVLFLEAELNESTLHEQLNSSDVDYINELSMFSTVPIQNKSYFPLMVMLTPYGPRIMGEAVLQKFKRKFNDNGVTVYEFQHNDNTVRYPDRRLSALSHVQTFIFEQAEVYNKFRTALGMKFNVKTPDVIFQKLNEQSTVSKAKGVLDYVKSIHDDFHLDDEILKHSQWQLTAVPLSSLHIPDPESGIDPVDPYDRVQYIDMYHVDDITAADIKRKPIVVDDNGHILDGNHRAVAARSMGMSTIPAWVPVKQIAAEQRTPTKFLRPGDLRGSYSNQDLVRLGFKRAQNGSWYISQARWDQLVQSGQLREDLDENFADLDSKNDSLDLSIEMHREAFEELLMQEDSIANKPNNEVAMEMIAMYKDWLKRRNDLDENFADGKKPGRKGLAKRMGVDCKQSVSKLRKIAKSSSGERQRMAHWCANMKAGKKK